MGRTVVATAHVESLITLLQADKTWRIGLAIGHITEQKDVVVHLAATPVDSVGISKKKSILDLDEVSITTHAEQVSRMLLGGMDILGVFVIASPNELKDAQNKLRQLVFAVFKCLSKSFQRFRVKLKNEERLLLQIDLLSGKSACKTFDVLDYKSVAKPSEWRLQASSAATGGWCLLETRMAINFTFHVLKDDVNEHFQDQLLFGLQPLLDMVRGATCVVLTANDTLRVLTTARATLLSELVEGADDSAAPRKAASRGRQPAAGCARGVEPRRLTIQLLATSAAVSPASRKDAVATFRMRGVITSKAYASDKATSAEAEEAVKEDLVKCLVSRCQLLAEDFLQTESEKHEQAGPVVVYETPVRVLLGFRTLTSSPAPVVYLCDYLFKDEKVEDCVERTCELLGVGEAFGAADVDTSLEHSADAAELSKLAEADLSMMTAGTSSSNGNDNSIRGLQRPTDYRMYIGVGAAVVVLAMALSYFHICDLSLL